MKERDNSTVVDLWQIPLRQLPAQREFVTRQLSAAERERAARFHFARDQEAFTVARGSLRLLLADYLNIAATAVPIQYAQRGKPYLPEPYSDLKFNLSHSGDWALLAVCDGRELGVDIEQIRPLPELETMAERFFSPAERDALRSLPAAEKPGAFFACWTRKEAYVKAVGDALYQSLDKFEVSLRPGEPARLLRVAGDDAILSQWSLHEIDAPPEYKAALVTQTPPHLPLAIRLATPDFLAAVNNDDSSKIQAADKP